MADPDDLRDDDAPGDGDDLLDVVQQAIERLTAHPDPDVRAESERLLAGIDAVHRTALTRLVALLQSMGGDALMTRLISDPAVRLLLMSYDLIAVDRRLMAEEALDSVRGHLHAHGVDIELVDVLGGVVSVQLHGADVADVPEQLIRQDIERALREGLRGFQQLEIGARRPTTSGGTIFVPLSGLRRLRAPVRQTVARVSELGPGQATSVDVDGHPVLLANIEGEFVAVQNRCGSSPLPLQFSTLDGAILTCSWHGCRYDLRTGHRVDGPGESLSVYPVTLADGDVQVTVATAILGEPS